MKRDKIKYILFALLLFSFLGVSIYGIVSYSHSGFDKSSTEGENKKHKVALVVKSTTSDFWHSVNAGAGAAATEYNLDITFTGPDNEEDYETQNEMILQAVKDGAEVLVFSAVDFNANADAINAAADAGLKIVVIDSDVNSDRVSCRISTDNYEAGRMAGQAALDTNSLSIKIGIVNFDQNSANGQQREQGFRDVVLQDDRVVLVDAINVISTTEDAKKATIQMMEQNPQINVIATFNEWTTLGVGYAIQDMELASATRVVAFDSNVVSVGMLETGEVDALIVQNPYAMGYLGVEAAYKLINGISLDSNKVDTATTVITRDNMYKEEYQRVLFSFN